MKMIEMFIFYVFKNGIIVILILLKEEKIKNIYMILNKKKKKVISIYIMYDNILGSDIYVISNIYYVYMC